MGKSVLLCAIKLVTMALWGLLLTKSSAEWQSYIIILLTGAVITVVNCVRKYHERFYKVTCLFSAIFAAFNVLILFSPTAACLATIIHVPVLPAVCAGVIVFVAAFFLMYEVITFLSKCSFAALKGEAREWRGRYFLVPFVIILVAYSLVLFLCKYPGNIDPDYKNVLDQIYGVAPITNHHPYYYTIFIKWVLTWGTKLFGDVNVAVCILTALQIVVLAFAEARAIELLYRLGINRIVVVVCFLLFLLHPVNMFYSFSLWKDTPFAAICMAACIILIKVHENMYQTRRVPGVLLLISLVGIVLFRSNGLFVLLIWFVAMLFLWRGKGGVRLVFAAALVVGFLLKNVVLGVLNVPQPDILESLAIPVQQITAVVHNGGKLTAEQEETLSKLVSPDELSASYNPCWVDFAKKSIRDAGNVHYLIDNKGLFLKTYIQIGLSNPAEYIKAWIYQTQGYWSLKESFTIWHEGIEPNTYGIARTVNCEAAEAAVDAYSEKFVSIFRILTLIAVYTWTVMASLCAAINRRNRLGIAVAMPAVSIFLSLLVAVPLDAEFRYAYAYIFVAPIVLIASTLITAREEL